MKISFEKGLQDIGLSEKESKVYLSSLEVGAAPVQHISDKAGVKRATTYVMIESLTERGLMSSVRKGKKVLFRAEPPSHLEHLVEKELEKANQKKELITALLPQISAIVAAAGEQPKISMYEGLDGLKEVQEDIYSYTKKGGEIDNFAAVDDIRELVSAKDMKEHWQLMSKKKIRIRSIYTKNGQNEKIPNEFRGLWKERRVSEKKFPFHGEIAVYGDRVAALSFKGKILGVIVESQQIAQTIKALFDLAWIGAEDQEIK